MDRTNSVILRHLDRPIPDPVDTIGDTKSRSDGPPKETCYCTAATPAIKRLCCGWR